MKAIICSAALIASVSAAPAARPRARGPASEAGCQPIPASSIEVIPGVGYRVTLRPGDHGDVTREHVFTVAFGRERASGDNEWHACLWPREDTLRCLYRPPMGM